MKKQLLFVGNKFNLNKPLQRYIIREVEKKTGNLDAIHFFQESHNVLFLDLEKLLSDKAIVIIVTTKSAFPVVGKLLSTVTADNQVLKNEMLLPSRTIKFEPDSYLLNHENAVINVLMATEGAELPPILVEEEDHCKVIQLFNEDIESAQALLIPLAQTYDVKINFTQLVSGWLQLQIKGRRYGNITQFSTSAKQLLSQKIIAVSNIAEHIIERMAEHKKKLTFAESCTGGQLASYFTKESGASTIFEGSLVTYSNALKSNWLAVNDLKLQEFGAVSSEVVDEMTDGALNVSDADYALAVSGIAGPDGGTEDKPVGTVFIGVRSKTDAFVQECHFEGDRNYIQEQSTLYAVKMLLMLNKEIFFK